LLLVFLGISFPPAPEYFALGPFQIFGKICGDIRKQGAPPVSTTMVANFSTRSAGVVDIGGKFSTSVNNTSGKLQPVSTTPAANFATDVNNTGGKQWEQLSNC
jgi:hypothetical protein